VKKPAKAVLLLALLAAAGALAVAAHSALSSRPHHSPHWDRALRYARDSARSKALIPALTARSRALAELGAVGREGPSAERSRAFMIAGLLELVSAGQDRGNSQTHTEQAAAYFRRAVRLDPSNDDAAYDLELLLTRSKASGHPVGDPRPEKKKTGAGRPGAQRSGSGY
jgi:tetratricopeptide (TPR) repeat protein